VLGIAPTCYASDARAIPLDASVKPPVETPYAILKYKPPQQAYSTVDAAFERFGCSAIGSKESQAQATNLSPGLRPSSCGEQ